MRDRHRALGAATLEQQRGALRSYDRCATFRTCWRI